MVYQAILHIVGRESTQIDLDIDHMLLDIEEHNELAYLT